MGYSLAGFDVVGVDIAPQPEYPFEFHKGDAIEFIEKYGSEFDLIHTSPPCQAAHPLTSGTNYGRTYPQLIPATRDALNGLEVRWIMENTAGAPIHKDVKLCGEMFGL